MDLLSAIFLGILQGLTEFLPVSSSGHLVIVQSLMSNFHQPGVLFDVVLHAGTVVSILVYFRKTIVKLNARYLLMLLLASIPAAILGYFSQDFFEGLFQSLRVVGFALIITALMNFLTDQAKSSKKSISLCSTLFTGFAQAFAIIPGISRSGATIFAATKTGIDKQKAAEFSFLLSIPAVAGANFLQIIKYGSLNDGTIMPYVFGFLAAFFSGYLAISLVISFLKKRAFRLFALYCLFAGVFALLHLN